MWSFLFFFLPPPLDWFTLAIEPASLSCFISTSSLRYQPLIVDFFISQLSNQVQQELEEERWWWMAAVQTLYGIIHQQSAGQQQQQLAAVLCVWVYHLFRYIISHFSLSWSSTAQLDSALVVCIFSEKEKGKRPASGGVLGVGGKKGRRCWCSRRVMKWDYARPSRSYA
jgi:hypothetical protein